MENYYFPWEANEEYPEVIDKFRGAVCEVKDPNWQDITNDIARMQFIAKAGNAYTIMMSRDWGITKTDNGWVVNAKLSVYLKFIAAGYPINKHYGPCPFEQIIKANKFYKENIENNKDAL